MKKNTNKERTTQIQITGRRPRAVGGKGQNQGIATDPREKVNSFLFSSIVSLQVGAAFCARNEHRTSLPEHIPHGKLDPRDRLLHQLLLQHLRLLQHGLQVPRDGESALLQREGRRQAEDHGHRAGALTMNRDYGRPGLNQSS